MASIWKEIFAFGLAAAAVVVEPAVEYWYEEDCDKG